MKSLSSALRGRQEPFGSAVKFRHSGIDFDLAFHEPGDHIARMVADSRTFYEIDLLEYIRRVGIRGPVAIDAGANVGNHSIYFGSFIASRVICVEPNPTVLPHLWRNTQGNPGSYQVVERGLGAAAGRARIEVRDSFNVGTARLVPGTGDVLVTTIDEVAPPTGVALIKIDVEGMELEVLRGARTTLTTQHPHVVAEAATEEACRALVDYLSPLGYRLLSRWAATPTYHFAHRPSLMLRARSRGLKWLDDAKKRLRGAG